MLGSDQHRSSIQMDFMHVTARTAGLNGPNEKGRATAPTFSGRDPEFCPNQRGIHTSERAVGVE